MSTTVIGGRPRGYKRGGDAIEPDRDDLPSSPSRRDRPLLTIVALLGLAALIWLPRGLELDRAVTTDESIWLARSGNFYQALANGDLDETFQYAHPGVTTMWAGAVAIPAEGRHAFPISLTPRTRLTATMK